MAERDSEQHEVRDSYGRALGALLLSVLLVIAAGAPIRSFPAILAVALQFLALGLTLRVSGVSRQWFRFGVAVLIAGFAVSSGAAVFGGDTGRVIALSGWLLFAMATIVSVVMRLRTYRRINLAFVLGLLCIYLLIGLTFGIAYQLVEALNPPLFAQGLSGLSGAVYFSFITLATVGYGDLTPVSHLARAMAVAEAIAGQLYLVSVVSLAVSRFGSGRTERKPEGVAEQE